MWRSEHIKAEIRIRKGSLSAFAAELDVDQTAVGKICDGHQSRMIQDAISRLIEVPLSELWPNRYLPSGVFKRKRGQGDA